MYNTFYEHGRNLPESGFKLGQKLGCGEKDPEKLVEFLKKQPADEICKHAYSILEELLKVKTRRFSKVQNLLSNTMDNFKTHRFFFLKSAFIDKKKVVDFIPHQYEKLILYILCIADK